VRQEAYYYWQGESSCMERSNQPPTGKFKAEYAGKLNFYLSAVDDLLKEDNDNPSIGIILCKEKNKLVAEYALKDMSKPIGVSEYKLLEQVPEELESNLPSIEEIEKGLENIE
jgi:hypothetical protein